MSCTVREMRCDNDCGSRQSVSPSDTNVVNVVSKPSHNTHIIAPHVRLCSPDKVHIIFIKWTRLYVVVVVNSTSVALWTVAPFTIVATRVITVNWMYSILTIIGSASMDPRNWRENDKRNIINSQRYSTTLWRTRKACEAHRCAHQFPQPIAGATRQWRQTVTFLLLVGSFLFFIFFVSVRSTRIQYNSLHCSVPTRYR